MFATESNIKRARSKKNRVLNSIVGKIGRSEKRDGKLKKNIDRVARNGGGSRSNDLNVQFDETRRAFFEDGNNEAGARDCN